MPVAKFADATEIPGFVLEDELGRGAYSIVYRARRGHVPCALKIARRAGRSARWFRREAVALARVCDAGLPTVLEVGETGGVPYLVMELVDGETLADRLRRGPLTESEALVIARGLARSLGAVHERGLVHRDVKPRNVILTPDGQVRLVDFGFARAIDRFFGGDVAGTRAYSAPEQLRPPAAVDGRADLYALGRVLLECLTGASPKDAAPVEPQLSQLRPALADTLRHLVAYDPNARYAGATGLLADLELVERGEAPLGPGAYPPERPEAVPFVGRDAEQARLRQEWADAKRGFGHAVLVRGVRGSGKTRLLETFVHEVASDGGHVLRARCEDSYFRPLAPLRALVDGYLLSLRSLPNDERARAEANVRQAASGHLAPLVSAVSPLVAALLGESAATSAQDGEAFAEAVAEFLLRLLRSAGPVLVVIDDLQWIDPLSREVLLRLAHRTRDACILFVAASRSDEAGTAVARFTQSLGGRLFIMDLPPLDHDAIAAIARGYLGTEAVDPVLGERIAVLADGTPLGALELLDAFVDAGGLRPHWNTWRFEPLSTEQASLPHGTLALLARRIEALPPASRGIVEAAAVLGARFPDALLARVVDVGEHDIGFALVDARRAGVLEPEKPDSHCFVHEAVREALLVGLTAERRRALHQRVAEALESRGTEGEAIYALATHYAAGEPARSPRRTYETCRQAGERALDNFDNETALRFFGTARSVAAEVDIALDAAFHRSAGEAQLRVGALDESLACFERALAVASEPIERAAVLGRIAWVHHMRADTDAAWGALARAFDAIGTRMPAEDVPSVAASATSWFAARRARGARGPLSSDERARLEIVCQLHYQNARLGLENSKPMRLVESAVQALSAAERLGPSRALARSYAAYGVVATALGLRAVGSRYLGRAQATAAEIADRVTVAYCMQMRFVGACWAGDIDGALALARECIDTHGYWLEVSEYCTLVGTAHQIETLRGYHRNAWLWVERAIERVRRHGKTPAAFSHYLIESALSTLTTLGRDAERRELVEHFGSTPTSPTRHGFFRLASWGPRVRAHTESGHLGAAFEALVAEFKTEGYDPKRAHPSLCDYYISVAHARMHQCMRASPDARPGPIAALGAALDDLRGAARLPLFRAHLRVVEGYHAWLTDAPRRARRLLAEAEALARAENAPWVLYEVMRARAHMLRDEGRDEAARGQASIAEFIAREHGCVHRVRFIREEFFLESTMSTSVEAASETYQSSGRSWRHLRALVEVARASTRDVDLVAQRRAVLDEVIRSLDARKGLLVYEPEHRAAERVIVGRTRDGADLTEFDPACRAILDHVRATAAPWPNASGHLPTPRHLGLGLDVERALAAPLHLHDRMVGVVYVERSRVDRAYRAHDAELLGALANQVVVALELGRALDERERLTETLRHAQKMEAIGQLAGGIAHDFNNMLAAIRSSLETLTRRPSTPARDELSIIEEAAKRASHLTEQLLAFARRQDLRLSVLDLNEVLSELAPMLRRLIGGRVAIDLDLAPGLQFVKTDRASFEQAIVNMVINARDAMPNGGALEISTRNAVLDERDGQERDIAAGAYACIGVSDNGNGMSPEVRKRAFEPFFTTKNLGGGTGLGLSMVYGFVRQSEGHIEVESELGRGTRFSIYLPVADEEANAAIPKLEPVEVRARRAPAPNETVLLVDDEPLVLEALQTLLETEGYRVLAADGAVEALDFARTEGDAIRLVITDVMMPGITGLELARSLADLGLRASVLCISGYAACSFDDDERPPQNVEFLQKPFDPGVLTARVRKLLDASATA